MCLCTPENKDMFCSKCYIKNYWADSSKNRVLEILNEKIKKTSLRKTAKYFDVLPSTVHRILKGKKFSDETCFRILNKHEFGDGGTN